MRSARLLPDSARRRKCVVMFDGRAFPLVRDRFGLRLRSRAASHPVNFCTGTFNETLAKKRAREHLEQAKAQQAPPTARTAHDLVEAYRLLSKRAGVKSEKYNIQRFTAILRETLGRPLKSVRLHEITPKLWLDFMAKRQGLPRADLSIRRPEHVSINTAVRAARCLIIESLREGYREHGITMPSAGKIQWLQEIKKAPGRFDEDAMLAAWEALPHESPMWWTIALARFAGLRKEEIASCRAGWTVNHEGVWCIEVKDRPEEQFYCKTGFGGLSPILDGEIIAAIARLPRDELVVQITGCRANWFDRAPQKWLRQFMGAKTAGIAKPLHRLRAAYLDAVRKTEMMRIQGEAIRAAAAAGRHTSDKTTREHYLPAQLRAGGQSR